MSAPSPSRAQKAGDRLRRAVRDPATALAGNYDLDQEYAVMQAWRAAFGPPLASAAMSLRSAVHTSTGLNPNGRVIQRHKREEQIVAKLVAKSMNLSRMEDIAGCRAIVRNLDEVEAVADRIRNHARTLTVLNEDNYIANPRQGGYRALHLHVLRDERQVEIQIRTLRQHEWADQVERWDQSSGHDVKHEQGPPAVVEAFRHAAEYMSELDHGNPGSVWASLSRDTSRELFTHWLAERRGRHG